MTTKPVIHQCRMRNVLSYVTSKFNYLLPHLLLAILSHFLFYSRFSFMCPSKTCGVEIVMDGVFRKLVIKEMKALDA